MDRRGLRPDKPQTLKPQAKTAENIHATDNAVSALGKVVEFQGDACGDRNQAMSVFLEYLPVTGDAEEGIQVTIVPPSVLLNASIRDPLAVCLVHVQNVRDFGRFVLQGPERVAGVSQSRYPRAVRFVVGTCAFMDTNAPAVRNHEARTLLLCARAHFGPREP